MQKRLKQARDTEGSGWIGQLHVPQSGLCGGMHAGCGAYWKALRIFVNDAAILSVIDETVLFCTLAAGMPPSPPAGSSPYAEASPPEGP